MSFSPIQLEREEVGVRETQGERWDSKEVVGGAALVPLLLLLLLDLITRQLGGRLSLIILIIMGDHSTPLTHIPRTT